MHGPALDALETRDLRRQALAKLRGAIVTGEFEADRLYPMSFVAERLRVSATPVREALLDLANEGLVEIVRNRGFRVVTLTETDLNEIFQLRLMLEVPAIRDLCTKLTSEDIAEHHRDAEEIARSAREGDLAGFLDADRNFHMRLLSRSNNKRLCAIVGRLRDHTRLYGLPSLVGSELLTRSADEHIELLGALESADRKRAEQLITQHLKHTRGIWAEKSKS